MQNITNKKYHRRCAYCGEANPSEAMFCVRGCGRQLDLKKMDKEELIKIAVDKVINLSKEQDEIFKELCEELSPTEYGEGFLFDYVFNRLDSENNFQEYINKYNLRENIFND